MNILQLSKPMGKEPEQQLAVLFTLATGRSLDGEGSCPAPESLAALVEGRLPQGQRAAMLEHLDRCSDCYRAWLGAAALLPTQQAGNVVYWRRPFVRRTLGTLALAASLVLALVRWDPFAPDLTGMLTQAYQTALLQETPNPSGSTKPLSMAGHGKAMALGFVNPDQSGPIRQAFVAGSNMGWETVQGRGVPSASSVDPEWAAYHHLGRWTFLLQTLCQANPPPSLQLLRQQAPLGKAIGALLAKREAAGEAEARIPRQELDAMHQLLNAPNAAESTQRLCRQIQKACATIAEGLFL